MTLVHGHRRTVLDADLELEVNQAERARLLGRFDEQGGRETATLPGRVDAEITEEGSPAGLADIKSRQANQATMVPRLKAEGLGRELGRINIDVDPS